MSKKRVQLQSLEVPDDGKTIVMDEGYELEMVKKAIEERMKKNAAAAPKPAPKFKPVSFVPPQDDEPTGVYKRKKIYATGYFWGVMTAIGAVSGGFGIGYLLRFLGL